MELSRQGIKQRRRQMKYIYTRTDDIEVSIQIGISDIEVLMNATKACWRLENEQLAKDNLVDKEFTLQRLNRELRAALKSAASDIKLGSDNINLTYGDNETDV
jgi:hypothetical protein